MSTLKEEENYSNDLGEGLSISRFNYFELFVLSHQIFVESS